MILLVLLLFFIGSCFGSFVNVVIDRLARHENIFIGHSHCDYCKKQIGFYDLIPVISYLILQGRCRRCKKHIPLRVLFVEMAGGLLFVLFFLFSFVGWLSYFLLCLISLVLLAISVIDMQKGVIEDKLLIVFGFLSFLFLFTTLSFFLQYHLLTAGIAFIFFLIIFFITQGRGIGFGDVKYALFIGFLLTPAQLIIAFYAAFLTGAFISIILIIARKKKLRGSTIPFGPFLSIGVFIALLFEKQIMLLIQPFLS